MVQAVTNYILDSEVQTVAYYLLDSGSVSSSASITFNTVFRQWFKLRQ